MSDWLDLVNAGTNPLNVANAQLTQAQTQGQDITNAGNLLTLQYRQALMNAPPPTNAAPMGDDSGADFSHMDVPGARAMVHQRFAPVPDTWSASEQQALYAARFSGVPGAAEAVVQQHANRISSINNARVTAATQQYSDLHSVATAPEGEAFNMLRVTEPGTADYFEQQGWTDDEQVRQHAADFAGLVHAGAQLPVEFKDDGAARDARTGEVIPGYDNAVGMSAKNRADVIAELQKPTNIKNSDGTESTVPGWQALHFPSLEAAVQHATALAVTRFGPDYNGNGPGDHTALAPTIAAVRDGKPAPGLTQEQHDAAIAQAQRQSAVPPPAGAPAGAPAAAPGVPPPAARAPTPAATPAQIAQATLARIPPAERGNYTDPTYQLPAQGPVRPGVSVAPEVQEQRTAVAKAATELLQEQGMNAKAAGQALRYYTLAQDVINSGNVTTGWGQEKLNSTAAALQKFGVPTSWLGDPSKSAELVKALTNAGLQSLKSTYGGKVTQSEVFLNLEHANPSADMPMPALRQLINDQVDGLKYDLATAQRARPYLATGNDPRSFDTWNQTKYPREQVAVSPQSRPGSSNAPTAAAAMPDPALNKGRSITNKATGQRLLSDGSQWVAVGGAR